MAAPSADCPSRTSLRTKLITALLALVIVALAAISVSSGWLLRSYLTSQNDTQLQSVFNSVVTASRISHPARARSTVRRTSILLRESSSREPRSARLAGSRPACPAERRLGSAPSVPARAHEPGLGRRHSGKLVTVPAQSGSDTWRVITEPITYQVTTSTGGTQQVNGTLIVGVDLGNINATIGRLAAADLIVGAIIVFVLALVGVAVVRANLRPLVEIEETAEEIADGHLNRRVPERDPRTEIGSLGPVAEHHAEPDRDRLPRAGGIRGGGAPVRGTDAAFHRRRQPRAAHAADRDPRLRRVLPPARRARPALGQSLGLGFGG